ncbi:MAG: carbohydrate porin [Pirellulaceae bacterium]
MNGFNNVTVLMVLLCASFWANTDNENCLAQETSREEFLSRRTNLTGDWRAAIADDSSNPLASFLSFGIGGNSPIAGRDGDTFGIGWFHTSSSASIPNVLFGDQGNGVELYYNVAATPWLHITPDIQFIDPSRRGVDTAIVFGLRAKMEL